MGDDKQPCVEQRILIADDERAIRMVFQQILGMSMPGCRVDLAVNGAEAVESFRSIHQKVILMDLKMPIMDGETAYHKIEELCEEENWDMPRVVFCTGYAPSEDLQKLVANNHRHVLLRKPVMNDLLLEVLQDRLAS